MFVYDFLRESSQQWPRKTAVIHNGQRATFSELDLLSDMLAGHLQANGIACGDRIALLLENGIDYVVAYYAILKAGAVAAPLNPALKPDGLGYLLNDLEPAAIISSHKSERLLKAVPAFPSDLKIIVIKNPKQSWGSTKVKVSTLEESVSGPWSWQENDGLQPADPASIIYTSGSTGQPKGVVLSHSNISANTLSICQSLSITQADTQMVVLPFFYVMGKSLLNTHVAAGATVVLNNRFLYPADVVNQMITEKVTSFSGVPSTYAYLLHRSPLAASREKLTYLRYCSQAGGHMSKSLKLALRKSLPEHTKIMIMYGATEAAARLTCLDPDHFQSKMESIGRPISGVTIRLLDAKGQEVADGQEGELIASGPNIMLGYWKDPQDTARVLTRQGYHTGDIGYRDSDGFLYALRRKDGLIKTGGHRVNPTEVEDLLMATDLLIEIAVVGVPDQLLGTKLIAVIVPKEEAIDTKGLMATCAKSLPQHKQPANIIIVRALPKSANGKIDRPKCAAIALKSAS